MPRVTFTAFAVCMAAGSLFTVEARAQSGCRWEPHRFTTFEGFEILYPFLDLRKGTIAISISVDPDGDTREVVIDDDSRVVRGYISKVVKTWTFRKIECGSKANPSLGVRFFLDYSFQGSCATAGGHFLCKQTTEVVLPERMSIIAQSPPMPHLSEDPSKAWEGLRLPPALQPKKERK